MPQLATSMSVPLSCPLYLDLNSALHPKNNFKSCFEMPDNSKNMLDMGLLYENLVKRQPNMCTFNPSLLAESFNFYLNQSCRNGDKSTSPKSFSIESILGFPNSPPSKDVFCNQLTFHDFSPVMNGHYPTPEFANISESYRPLQGPVQQSSIVKEHMPNAVGSAITTGTADCTGRPMDKFHGTLKNYPGLNRKSGKSFKSTSKSLNSNPCKSKRVRTIFTPEQLERLETEFERQQYMVGSGRHYLASTLNLSEAQVKVWFQNRRIKWRKQHLEGHQENGVKEEKELL